MYFEGSAGSDFMPSVELNLNQIAVCRIMDLAVLAISASDSSQRVANGSREIAVHNKTIQLMESWMSWLKSAPC